MNLTRLIVVHSAAEGGAKVEPCEINITLPLSASALTETHKQTFSADAEEIGEALLRSLPVGTLDQLLVYLLRHKCSLFVTPSPRVDKP